MSDAQQLNETEPFPYSYPEYFRRILWFLLHKTLWKLMWHKLPGLRSSLLRYFGAQLDGSSLFYGTVNILRPHGLKVGKHVAIGPRTHIYNLASLEIGDNTVISQDVYLCGGSHDYTKGNLPLLKKEIQIGSGVWICAGAFIGPGVTIGDGAVIAARAVVVSDVAPMTIVGGNPARKINDRVMEK